MNNLYYLGYETVDSNLSVWQLNLNNPNLLTKVTSTDATVAKGIQMTQVGNYILQWSSLNNYNQYTYSLFQFDPTQVNPLGSINSAGKWTDAAVQQGSWSKDKFFGSRSDFANPHGAQKGYESGTDLVLISLHNFVLNWIPTEGRGTYQLFNFDPGSSDPLPAPYTPQGAWSTIQEGHELIYSNGFVIDWNPKTSEFALWQFDAQSNDPLRYPAIQKGNWKSLGIDINHSLTAIDQYVLDRNVVDNTYRLWQFDQNNPFVLKSIEKEGTLSDEIKADFNLIPVETLIKPDIKMANNAGTLDFMRGKIEHIVYYMIENRSFDHVCGWLYDKKDKIKVIGPDGAFRGVDENFTNTFRGKQYPISKYNDGKLSKTLPDGSPFVLDLDQQDPYHDNSDVLRQMYAENIENYRNKRTPDMGGFASNNGTAEVMMGYSPEQLPILNGLAKHFAVSDDWFCSLPGGTDVNRAFSLTGSSLGQLNNFQNGAQYSEWANFPHRPSIWKVLWSNGITDFKIYNAVEWMECQFTYNLFLKGQIPTIDDPFNVGNYIPQLNQFYDDLKYGSLPKFSFLEPKWVASMGSTSYHPGNDLIPGERTLNDIFNAIQDSEYWDKTLFVITFDEHGGLADHVPPPFAVQPFAGESIDGFNFDVMGVRIPTIMVSPYVAENTVFRSTEKYAYDSTSILATILKWAGVPKSHWGMGERVSNAPTFEAIFQEQTARTGKISLTPPWDSVFPPITESNSSNINPESLPIHDLHRLVVPRMITDMTPNLSTAERQKITNEILNKAKNQGELHKLLDELNKEHSGKHIVQS